MTGRWDLRSISHDSHMLKEQVHHDCHSDSCVDCPVCDVCDWCQNCTDCHLCVCPSDDADELLRWLESRRNICQNCFRVAYPIDRERDYVEYEAHVYEDEWHADCGCGRRSPGTVHRWWGADQPHNLPMHSSAGLTFTEVLDTVLGRFEDLYVPVDREGAFTAALRRKRDSELWSTRDRDCILYALDAAMDIDTVLDELGWDGLDRVADRSY